MTRAKQANESSTTDPKESKHGQDLYQNAGEGDRSYVIDFKGRQNFGERQATEGTGLKPKAQMATHATSTRDES